MNPCSYLSEARTLAKQAGEKILEIYNTEFSVQEKDDKSPLTALACEALLRRAAAESDAPEHLVQVLLGGAAEGAALAAHEGVPIVSATGSTAMISSANSST